MLSSLIAYGTDAMLPSFPLIAADLRLEDANQAQLVITIFVLGSGLGQLFFGPLSDAVGRKPSISAGIALFIFGCLICYFAESLVWMLIGRFIQGLGISAPRTVTIALVRDLYKGRAMAQVMSFTFGVFILVPAIAPMVGQQIMLTFGWRSIYLSFIVFSAAALIWMTVRLAESHPASRRRVLKRAEFLAALKEVLTHPVVLVYTGVQGLLLGGLFAYLSSAQQIFVDSYGVGENFPLYFASVTLISGLAAFVNGTLVLRLGMRRMCKIAFGLSVLSSAVFILFQKIAPADWQLAGFLGWSMISFLLMSLAMGNINALAMEPMGHISGLASAVIGAAATVIAVILAVPIGLAFSGTPIPLSVSYFVLYLLGFGVMHLRLQEASVD